MDDGNTPAPERERTPDERVLDVMEAIGFTVDRERNALVRSASDSVRPIEITVRFLPTGYEFASDKGMVLRGRAVGLVELEDGAPHWGGSFSRLDFGDLEIPIHQVRLAP